MRIGIDASRLVMAELTGIEYSTLELVRRLAAAGGRHEYALYFRFRKREFAQRFAERVAPVLSDRVGAHVCRIPGKLMQLMHRHYPLERTLGRCDVVHYPNFFLHARLRGARVVTVHDLIPFSHPEYCADWLVAFFERELPRSLRSADALIAVSHHTRRELIERLGLPAERIAVVQHGVDRSFRPAGAAAVAALRARLGLARPYLFALGHAQPRKNIVRLVEALALCRARGLRDLELVIAGQPGLGTPLIEARAAALGLRGALHRFDYVSYADLPTLYSGAEASVMPSLTEGFGLPVIEAMACGTPVIASRGGALPEVVADAGLLVEPTEVEDIAAAIERVLGDRQFAAGMAERGLKRAADFTWERSAREHVALYEALA